MRTQKTKYLVMSIVLGVIIALSFAIGSGQDVKAWTPTGSTVNVESISYFDFMNEIGEQANNYIRYRNNLNYYAESGNVEKNSYCGASEYPMANILINNIPILDGNFGFLDDNSSLQPSFVLDDSGRVVEKYRNMYSYDNRKLAMLYNTWFLQALVNCSSNYVENKGGSVNIKIPAGIYYFLNGHSGSTSSGSYIIQPKSNVTIAGMSSGNDRVDAKMLKPYAESSQVLSMFYSSSELTNVGFSQMFVDGKYAGESSTNGSGSGFRIDGCKNCLWSNLTVENMPANGIRVTNLTGTSNFTNVSVNQNGRVISDNSSSLGNLMGLASTEASGIYVNKGADGSVSFDSVKATANKTYGIFVDGSTSEGASENFNLGIQNSVASNNACNFAFRNLRNAYFWGNSSNVGNLTKLNTLTAGDWTNVALANSTMQSFTIDANAARFNDNSDTKDWSYDSSLWAEETGVVTPIVNGDSINGNLGGNASFAEVATWLWKLYGYPAGRGGSCGSITGDVAGTEANVVNARAFVSSNGLDLDSLCSSQTNAPLNRAQMMRILYRLAGSPSVSPLNKNEDYLDVKQENYNNGADEAYKAIVWGINRISNGLNDNNRFHPDWPITRREALAFIYRFMYVCDSKVNGGDDSCSETLEGASGKNLLDLNHNNL